MSSYMEVSYSSLIIIPVVMREYPFKVPSYGICPRDIRTYAY